MLVAQTTPDHGLAGLLPVRAGEDPYAPLAAALRTQPRNSEARPLILMLVDSHTAGPVMVGHLRELMQARFGSAGPGRLPPGRAQRPINANQMVEVGESGEWVARNALRAGERHPCDGRARCGLSGSAAAPRASLAGLRRRLAFAGSHAGARGAAQRGAGSARGLLRLECGSHAQPAAFQLLVLEASGRGPDHLLGVPAFHRRGDAQRIGLSFGRAHGAQIIGAEDENEATPAPCWAIT